MTEHLERAKNEMTNYEQWTDGSPVAPDVATALAAAQAYAAIAQVEAIREQTAELRRIVDALHDTQNGRSLADLIDGRLSGTF